MRFLFVSIQGFESDFDGRVGAVLRGLGHDVEHLTASRLAARRLRRAGEQAVALQELLDELPPATLDDRARIEDEYGLRRLADLYGADSASDRLASEHADARALAHVLAVEQAFDRTRPDIVVPEVGRELIRTVAHRVALRRGVRTFFLFYTIFPRPLRLYENTMQRPIVPPGDVRELSAAEIEEVERFRDEFVARDAPIRPHRRFGLTLRRVRRLVSYSLARLGVDRDNDYLHPLHWTREIVAGALRSRLARSVYRDLEPGRRYVYFPLHDAADYKIRQLVPHLADQEEVARRLAAALPEGIELVVKEHPLSIGRNPLSVLRRLARAPSIRVVAPRTSTHRLIAGAEGVAVISSTVGLEALLHGKPVLTLGVPFYAGYGLTVDVNGLDEADAGVEALLRFRPDERRTLEFLHAAMRACRAGAPVLVDDSDANAQVL
ncbi:MAG TPA: hypothetical protein VFK17_02675, partial [Gaiellaceae bacterium]|nr:hypothetical protein [Gaiellaceae bacterium]